MNHFNLPDLDDLEEMDTNDLLNLISSIKAELSLFSKIESAAGKIVRDRLLKEYTEDGVVHPGVPGMKVSYSPGGEPRKPSVDTKMLLAEADKDPNLRRFVKTGLTAPSIRLLFDMEYVP